MLEGDLMVLNAQHAYNAIAILTEVVSEREIVGIST
jgi:hypothetical protein